MPRWEYDIFHTCLQPNILGDIGGKKSAHSLVFVQIPYILDSNLQTVIISVLFYSRVQLFCLLKVLLLTLGSFASFQVNAGARCADIARFFINKTWDNKCHIVEGTYSLPYLKLIKVIF